MKVLIKSSFNWADEFDVDGFAIMTREDYDAGVETISKYFSKFDEFSLYFGTNEELTFSSDRDLLSQLDVTDISDIQASLIETALGNVYGLVDFSEIIWMMEDELERFDDEEGEY